MDKEKFDLDNFPTSESAKRQIGYVTGGFYDNSYVGKWLFQAIGLEYDEAREILEELPKQFFPETATWGLMYHEIKWGLPVRENLPYGERRRLIYQKRDFKAPMTPYRMEKYLENAFGFKAHVMDIHDAGEHGFCPRHPNRFRVDFVGEGTLDAKAVRIMLDSLKQSHTVYTINDRVIITLDNRQLEKSSMPKASIRARLPFWQKKLLDGSWGLDGDTPLNATLQKMHVGMAYQAGVANVQETVGVSMVSRKNEWHLDGMQLMDGSKEMNAEVKEEVL